MITISNTLRNIINQNVRLIKVRASVGSLVIQEDAIINFSISDKLTANSTYVWGSATSRVLNITLAYLPWYALAEGQNAVPFIWGGKKISVDVGFYGIENFYDINNVDPDAYSFITLGTFVVDANSIERDNNQISITAYDAMEALGRKKFKFSGIQFPATAQAVIDEIGNQANIRFDLNTTANPTFRIFPKDSTIRDVLMNMAEVLGGNWRENRETGDFVLQRYRTGDPQFTINANQVESFKFLTDSDIQIGGVANSYDEEKTAEELKTEYNNGAKEVSFTQFAKESTHTTKTTTVKAQASLDVISKNNAKATLDKPNDLESEKNSWGYILNLSNPNINTQTKINNVYTRAHLPITYRGYEMVCQGLPFVEVGDKFRYIDPRGREYDLHVVEHNLSYDKGLKSTLRAEGLSGDLSGETSTSSSNNSISGQINKLTGTIENIASLSTAEINNLYVQNEEVRNIVAGKASVEDLQATNARIQEIDAGIISTERLESALANIDVLTVGIADATYAKIADLESANANIGSLETRKANVEQLEALEAQIGQIEAGTIDADVLRAVLADIGSLTVDTADLRYAKIGDLEASSARIDEIEAGYIKTGGINSKTGVIDEIFNNYMLSDTFVADNITAATGSFTKYLTGVNIVGDNIVGGTITADKLILKGTDGLIYEINANSSGLTKTELEQDIYKDKIDGSAIVGESITGTQIAANTITSNHLQANTIIGDNISSNTITSDKLATNSVTTEKIEAGAITADKLDTNSITTDKIQSGSITADKLASGAITAEKIDVSDLSALSATVGGWDIGNGGLFAETENGNTYFKSSGREIFSTSTQTRDEEAGTSSSISSVITNNGQFNINSTNYDGDDITQYTNSFNSKRLELKKTTVVDDEIEVFQSYYKPEGFNLTYIPDEGSVYSKHVDLDLKTNTLKFEEEFDHSNLTINPLLIRGEQTEVEVKSVKADNIKHGTLTVPITEHDKAISFEVIFDKAFPDNDYTVVATGRNTLIASEALVKVTARQTTGFKGTIQVTTGQTYDIMWIAIE